MKIDNWFSSVIIIVAQFRGLLHKFYITPCILYGMLKIEVVVYTTLNGGSDQNL